MKKFRIISSNNAVAGVIEALLLIGLVAVIISIIQLTYIPEIMKQKESDHMDDVSNQFSNLKSVIEIQSLMGVMDSEETIAFNVMSSPITLGSKELPYFISARSYGNISLRDEELAGNYRIDLDPNPFYFPYGIPLTSLKYEAFNSEFVDQRYILEGGGVILNQTENETMRINPGINIINHSDLGYIKFQYLITVFNGVAGKKEGGGYNLYEDYYIYTNYTTHYSHDTGTNKIFIYTDYPDAWYKSLVEEGRGLIYEYYKNGYINVVIDRTTTPDSVKITTGTKSIAVELTIVVIGIQVGPGYVVSGS